MKQRSTALVGYLSWRVIAKHCNTSQILSLLSLLTFTSFTKDHSQVPVGFPSTFPGALPRRLHWNLSHHYIEAIARQIAQVPWRAIARAPKRWSCTEFFGHFKIHEPCMDHGKNK